MDVVERFDLVEADFRREYHTDVTEFLRWSERQFSNHLRGLSGRSAFLSWVVDRAQPEEVGVVEIEDLDAGEAAVLAMVGDASSRSENRAFSDAT